MNIKDITGYGKMIKLILEPDASAVTKYMLFPPERVFSLKKMSQQAIHFLKGCGPQITQYN